MSKIVVAIDFSDCSINAFKHALSIAQKCSIDMLLVWVEKPDKEKDRLVDQINDISGEVKQKFDAIISEYQPVLPRNRITYKVREGKVYREIASIAKKERATLVVAGTHGASGFEEFWIGSNANRIVTACECPVITIRAGIDIQRPLSRIVFPVDSTLETRQKATFTAYLAKHHDAEVHILRLYTSKIKAIRQNVNFYSSQVERYFTQEGIRFIVKQIDTTNLAEAMVNYAKEVEANLISIMTEQETTTSNLWMGPYAQQVVNHSPIPVLSLHSRELLTIATA